MTTTMARPTTITTGPGGHTHELPEDVAPLSRRGLVVLATSGGIVPSPSAVIVVIAAFSLGRSVLGLTLIAAFSIGLAATLDRGGPDAGVRSLGHRAALAEPLVALPPARRCGHPHRARCGARVAGRQEPMR